MVILNRYYIYSNSIILLNLRKKIKSTVCEEILFNFLVLLGHIHLYVKQKSMWSICCRSIMLLSQDGFSNRIGFYWAVVEIKVTGSVLAQPPFSIRTDFTRGSSEKPSPSNISRWDPIDVPFLLCLIARTTWTQSLSLKGGPLVQEI